VPVSVVASTKPKVGTAFKRSSASATTASQPVTSSRTNSGAFKRGTAATKTPSEPMTSAGAIPGTLKRASATAKAPPSKPVTSSKNASKVAIVVLATLTSKASVTSEKILC